MERQTSEPGAKGDKPDYKGTLEVAAWLNRDRDGHPYISVVLGSRIKLVPNEEKSGE